MTKQLSHLDEEGKAKMVDVSAKPDELRIATAEGFIRLQPETLNLINNKAIPKGEVLTVAELAGIQAAKNVPQLIPLCHTLMLSQVIVKAEIVAEGVSVKSQVKCTGKTGVEMEALTAVAVALLTVYDMCKAVDKSMVIEKIQLTSKTKTAL
ncbi:MAG: cyclic pyranopterin monophosphate synthase MoaC [Bacteroidales bacterium]